MIFGLLVSSTVAGALLPKFGRWKIYLVAGAIVMTIDMLLLGPDLLSAAWAARSG